MMERLGDIAHVKIVRFHTRVPVVEPERVDAALIAALKASGKTTYRGAPCQSSARADGRRRGRPAGGWSMRASSCSARSVLLRGINDDADGAGGADARPSSRLRVKPYYLHHPDLAPGHRPFPRVDRRGAGAGGGACAAGCRDSASRPMCSIFPAATASRRSAAGYVEERGAGLLRGHGFPRQRAHLPRNS